ncbi:HNH endonuclease [Tardiphaga sp. OK245]|uniref:HNH endonuclease n=1 Tax=Tardiphaga sp. OK245 TaxID=1855306 RepID=UPI0008A738FF|nr:HNH endonuclease [Tardiphaga sp. OK245]SEI15773.1 putative restriction endonuclease [Tardiphaga sp. OK245]
MPKKERRNWYPVAAKAWPVLADIAARRTVIFYKDLAGKIGEHHRAVRYVLGVIQEFCMDSGLPPLTAVVVSKTHGIPGDGFIAWEIDDLEAGLGYVYSKDWTAMANPYSGFGSEDSIESFAGQLIDRPEGSGDVYRQVKDRGVAQRIFKEAVLIAYDYKCAMCDFSFYRALEAHHIVPFFESSVEERIAVSNGILLCPNHHKLVELECFEIKPDMTIEYYDPKGNEGPYTESDRQASIDIHHKKLRTPTDPKLKPKFPVVD